MTPMYKYRASWMKIFSCAPSLVLCWSLNNFRSLSFKSPPNNHYYACLFSPYLGHWPFRSCFCAYRTRQTLRCRFSRARANPIKFSKGAKEHLTNLGLAKGSAERKEVKEYHRKIVAEEMAKNGAHSAQIVHLAHKQGSVDPKLHITAGFWDKDDKRIKSTYGTPPKTGQLHHVYAEHHPVNPTYLNAVHAAGKTL
ncbi:hypothetical protein BDZ97DRAFT_350558 [Flammula alnicola]|nr:hypothetical protein BDZ97DRAFT_350558 [Flammula alnicola]